MNRKIVSTVEQWNTITSIGQFKCNILFNYILPSDGTSTDMTSTSLNQSPGVIRHDKRKNRKKKNFG